MHTILTGTECTPMCALAYGCIPPFAATLAGDSRTPSPQPRSRALCVSRSRTLGEIRRAVLQHRFDTVFVSSLDEIWQLSSASSFDVIVLCHTLSLEERQRCVATTSRLWPVAKIVLVASEIESPEQGFDRVVVGLAGPEVLLNAVQQVLRPAVSFAELG